MRRLTSGHAIDKLEGRRPHSSAMSLAWALKNLLSCLLLPPGNGLLLLGLAGLFRRRRRRWALPLAVLAGTLLLAQSLPIVAQVLITSLERQAGPVFVAPDRAGAIVILGGGLDQGAPEYGGDTAIDRTLLRLRYGATLARRHPLPVLVAGGRPGGAERSEAAVMAEILEHEFKVPVRWQEADSKDTAENAAFAARILKTAGISRVVLVTQAFHMPRARALFERAGLEVVPAPTAFRAGPTFGWEAFDLLPQAGALHTSYYALHEWLGIAWMRLSR
jgi:uncharacterized SAM-binding protein YcdF (DUF218 family)